MPAPTGGGMPWLSIIVTLISFFLAGGSKPENRAKAAAIGLAAGTATYGITHYTDWGKANLGQLDGVTVTGGGEGDNVKTPTATTAGGSPINVGTGSAASGGSTGLFSALGGALSKPVVAGATGLAAGSLISGNTLKWIAIGLGVFLILKD